MSNSTSNIPADTDTLSSSSKDEIIRGLNEDLAREYNNYPICSLQFYIKGCRIWRYCSTIEGACIAGTSTCFRGGQTYRLSRRRSYSEKSRG